MSTQQKLINKLKSLPTDLTFSEVRTLLKSFGYVEFDKGSTSGSRVLFIRKSDGRKIMLHKPHPQKELKKYAVQYLLKYLIDNGDIK